MNKQKCYKVKTDIYIEKNIILFYRWGFFMKSYVEKRKGFLH